MKIIKIIIFIFLISILISVLYSKYVKKEPIIKVFGNAFLIVTTGSMEPTISSEELIIIHNKNSYKKGDIITYIDEDGFMITHRIIEINSDTFITKGDANNVEDEPCKINRIQGKVIFHSKFLGVFVLYLLKPICFIYAIFIIIVETIKMFKKGEYKNEKTTNQI